MGDLTTVRTRLSFANTILLAAIVVSMSAIAGVGGAAPQPPGGLTGPNPADAAFFEARVRPLLLNRCAACHGEKQRRAALRLDMPSGILRGGESGPVVVAGDPDASRLIQAVRWLRPGLQMPPAGRLAEREVELLVEWVRRGAAMPATAPPRTQRGRTLPMSLAEGRRFWSFRPLTTPAIPAVRHRAWPKRPIDHYVLATMEAHGLEPSPPADRRALIRRLALDLTGLPPSPEEVDAFLGDHGADATARLVDRLLASDHYGERWGRHWLDLVRYCDVPEEWARVDASPWLYRDWVVRALNQDMPYDQFVQRQLAADQMPEAGPEDIAALGLLGLSPTYWKELKLAPDVIRIVVAEEWEERIGTLSGALLATTVACARCHDHKQDPVTMRDYYAMAGVLASVRQVARPLLPAAEEAQVRAARERVAALDAEAKQLRDAAQRDPARAAEMKTRADGIAASADGIRKSTPGFTAPTAYAVEDAAIVVGPDGDARTRVDYRAGEAQNLSVQPRGNPERATGPKVPRRFLELLSGPGSSPFRQGSGRRDLGQAIFGEGKALAARVIVNRVWRHHFGRGLVETPSNFGITGDRPTHPELLDSLSGRFIRAGWSLKWLHREIVLSAAYSQSSRITARSQRLDPENRWLSRMSRRRLEVEPWRDTILAATGRLDRRIGGAPEELSAAGNIRRTLYGTVRRQDLDDLLRLYDFPDPIGHSPARFHTTTPLQQLFVLNSAFIGREAAALSARLETQYPGDLDAQLGFAYRVLYGRLPSSPEAAAARRYLGQSPNVARRQAFLEVLLASNELMYVE